MADFYWDAYWPFTRTLRYSTVITRFENGMEARRQRWSKPIREYEFEIRPLDPYDELEKLLDFFKNKKGSLETFTFHDPIDNEDVTVRFGTDDLPVDLRSYRKPYLKFKLIEVL